MPLYPHLEDAAKFDAESLNTRFTLLVDAINAVGGAALQEQALNTIHVPSPLITNTLGDITAENDVDIVDTPDVPGGSLQVTTGDGAYETFSNEGYSLVINSLGWTLDRSPDDLAASLQPTAVLILANVEVREFTGIEIIRTLDEWGTFGTPVADGIDWGISLNEYSWEAAVALQFVDSAGTTAILTRSERQVSPRVTIGNYGNHDGDDPPVFSGPAGASHLTGRIAMGPLRDLPGFSPVVYEQFDYKTFQDVAIRTVITKDDLTDMGLTNIASVKLAFKSFSNRTYRVQRANMTAIPLLAEVNT